MNVYFFFGIKKPSLRFRKGGAEEDALKQGLPQPTSDNNLPVHALMSVNTQLLAWLMCSSDVVVLLNQSTKDVYDANISLFSSFYLS